MAVTEQEHKFGEYGFGRTVITAHYARVFEFATGSVSAHLYATPHTLAHIDDNDAFVHCLFQ